MPHVASYAVCTVCMQKHPAPLQTHWFESNFEFSTEWIVKQNEMRTIVGCVIMFYFRNFIRLFEWIVNLLFNTQTYYVDQWKLISCQFIGKIFCEKTAKNFPRDNPLLRKSCRNLRSDKIFSICSQSASRFRTLRKSTK